MSGTRKNSFSCFGCMQAGCFVMVMVILASCAAIVILPNYGTRDEAPVARVSKATVQPTAVVRGTPTVVLTPTVTPTAGPTPTPTKIPTATPMPTPTALVSLGVDRTSYTELQWKAFVSDLKGKLISGQGEIDQVYSSGMVMVDIHIGAISRVHLNGLAIDDAAKLSKKQVIHFTGWLVDVDDIMGYLFLDVDVTEWH